jgi:hypothetical protein
MPRAAHDISAAVVAPISLAAAARVIDHYEPTASFASHAFGLFCGEILLGAVIYGADPIGNLRQASVPTLALKRGALLPGAPFNAASKLIGRSIRQLPRRIRQVVAFADSTHGERGVVLKAAGFTIAPSYSGKRVMVHHRGKLISERTARHRFGTSSARQLAALGLKVETVPRRQRYAVMR